jgi:hypothetical protein
MTSLSNIDVLGPNHRSVAELAQRSITRQKPDHPPARAVRLAAGAAMLAGVLLTGTTTAFAAPSIPPARTGHVHDPSGWDCASLTGSADLSQPIATATAELRSCNGGAGNGLLTSVFDVSGAPGPGSVAWSDHTTSLATVTAIFDFSGAGCSPGSDSVNLTISFTAGRFVGLSGTDLVCASGFPVMALAGGTIVFA